MSLNSTKLFVVEMSPCLNGKNPAGKGRLLSASC